MRGSTMPYAVCCPRCKSVVVLESLGAFDCPHCAKTPSVPVQTVPLSLPLPPPLIPRLAPRPPPVEIDWQPPAALGPVVVTVDDDDGAELHRRRARAIREKVARRKLLWKLGVTLVLFVVTTIAVRAAYLHLYEVADHNAKIKARG